MSRGSLQDKVAVVTGAGGLPGRGMGRAIADAVASAGAGVVAVDRDLATAEQTARAIRKGGGHALAVEADVADPADVDRLIDRTMGVFGRIDILFNHAGIADTSPAAETSPESWRRIIDVNLTAPFLTSHAVLPIMLDKGEGVIVNTISVAGLVGGRAGAAYTASKHGLVGLTRNIAVSYGQLGIRCVGIAPGLVRAGGAAPDTRGEAAMAHLDQWPGIAFAGQPGRPEDVAGVAVFLAGPGASYVNGAVVPVDGAWSTH